MTYDITIIRPEMREEQVKPRGRALSGGQRKAVRRALRTLHALEIMAVKIYQVSDHQGRHSAQHRARRTPCQTS